MLRYVIAYLATAVIFLGVDFVWLSRAIGFYKSELGDMIADKPNLAVAAIFYAIYVAGIVVLAVLPALREGSWITAVLSGAVLGLVAYATYDLTNLATLRQWSVTVAVVDIGAGGLFSDLNVLPDAVTNRTQPALPAATKASQIELLNPVGPARSGIWRSTHCTF